MPMNLTEDFITNAYKTAISTFVLVIAWFCNQIYGTMKDIQLQFISMDKRVGTIEQSRSYYLERYLKLEGLVEDRRKDFDKLQNRISEMEAKLQRGRIF